MRFQIMDLNYGKSDLSNDCIIAEVKVKTDTSYFWLSLADVEGIPNFYKSDKPLFEYHMNDETDEELWDEINQKYFIDIFDYDDVFDQPDAEYYELYRYLIYCVRLDEDEMVEFKHKTVWKMIDEINIPKSDVEEDYEEDIWDHDEC